MEWFRWFNGSTTDPKFAVVARKSGQNVASVLGVWAMLLERANQADDRGSVDGFDCEGADALLGLDDGTSCSIVDAMKAKGLIAHERIAKWEQRQPKREDNSTGRVRAYRERQKKDDTGNGNGGGNATKRDETHGNARLEEKREEKREDNKPPTESCSAELREARTSTPAPSAPPSPVFVRVPLTKSQGQHPVTEADADRLQELYPAVDVKRELLAIVAWCEANPSRRKTRTGVKAFLTNWLKREQDRGGTRASPVARAAPLPVRDFEAERLEQSRRERAAWAAAGGD